MLHVLLTVGYKFVNDLEYGFYYLGCDRIGQFISPGEVHRYSINIYLARFAQPCIETALFTILVPQVSMNFYSWEVGLGHFLNKTKNVYFYWTH